MSSTDRTLPRNPNLVLAFLLLAYILNFLDRQLLSILAQPIKESLSLSDTEFGAIAGLAFALLYSIAGVPLSLLADRTSRSKVIAGSLAVWSGFTALCGTTQGYWSLFLCRLGVGVGEAGGVAPSYALIADYFPPERRGRALGIFSLGVPLGLGSGLIAGAYIATYVDWRAAFLIMGVLGLVLVPLFLWAVKDPPRAQGSGEQVRLGAVFSVVAKKPSFWLLAFAASLSSLVGYGLAVWIPSVFMRSYGLSLIQAGQFMGSLLLIGGVIGVFAGGLLADRLGHGDKRWYAWLPAVAWLVTVPCYFFGLTTGNLWLAWLPLAIGNALNILWLGPITTAIQHLVERPMRATASALFLLINNLVGLGVGPLLIGAISDSLRSTYGPDSLRYAAIGALGFYLLASLLGLLAARRMARDWVADTPAQ
ncbi:spinster family MFS transporter [Sphingomonas mesophila]|uniref:spinster family MFS transporter n=1 Tax=Sphingomonas mesophila TaxID=2303576 RepID=UPI000E57AE1E|nr:MFS transporter [Sphingomonas mesophila]